MIVEPDLRLGTHSTSGIFHEARKMPTMAHAVRHANRDWWKSATKECGAPYRVTFAHKQLAFSYFGLEYDVPANGYVVQTQTYQGLTNIADKLVSLGARRDWLWLALPCKVFELAAREHGLQCRACDAVEIHDHFNDHFLCGSCEKLARRAGSVEAFLARQIFKRVQQIKKEQMQ